MDEGALLRRAPGMFALWPFLDSNVDAQHSITHRLHHCASSTWRVVLPRVGAIVVALRDAEIGDGQVHPARHVFTRKDQFAGMRANSFGHHDTRITFPKATGKGHVHAVVGLLYANDAVIKT
ncbi:hypothetical protein LN572_15830, partial [Xanthomonas citri pv. fuscans]|nr:hypothetical protein [Xanthomonas citri pv. fuscans]